MTRWKTYNVLILPNFPAGLDRMTLAVFLDSLPTPGLVGVPTLGLPHCVALLLLLGLLATNTTTSVSHVTALISHTTATTISSSSSSRNWQRSGEDDRTDRGTRVVTSTTSRVVTTSSPWIITSSTATTSTSKGRSRYHGPHDGS